MQNVPLDRTELAALNNALGVALSGTSFLRTELDSVIGISAEEMEVLMKKLTKYINNLA